MLSNHSTNSPKPFRHLFNLLKSQPKDSPNFVLLLGAGASAESGVKTTRDMITEWRKTYVDVYGLKDDEVNSTPWFNSPSEYSTLFEILYNQPSLRRDYIEHCVENANPSWGYMYLVELMRMRVFNTIFTTNFDDLLNEACYLYSTDVRPIVCAHDSSIRSVRITSKRPKIIKLHGDFLFDNIKNTVRELESLEANMRDKLKQYSNEFGMVVIGYAGNDRTVMDNLDSLLRNDESFPHGIYWCIRKGSKISPYTQSLTRFDRFHLVEINGFDEFFSELYGHLNTTNHPLFTDPFAVVTHRINGLLNGMHYHAALRESRSVLARDIASLCTCIERRSPNDLESLSPILIASVYLHAERYDSAASKMENSCLQKLTPDNVNLSAEILGKHYSENLCTAIIDSISSRRFSQFQAICNCHDVVVALLKGRNYETARRVLAALELYSSFSVGLAAYTTINLSQIYLHQREELPGRLSEELNEIVKTSSDTLTRFGALVALEKFEEGVNELVSKQIDGFCGNQAISVILGWPISDLLPDEQKERLRSLIVRK